MKPSMKTHSKLGGDRRRGFTLIELIVAIVILGLVSTTLVHVIGESVRARMVARDRAVGIELARSLLEEILSQAFEDPDEASGSFATEEGSRSTFDDVDDYDGLHEAPPTDASGVAIAGAAQFARDVVVRNVLVADPDAPMSDGSTDLKRIEVIVVGNDETLRLYGLKASL